MSKSAEEQQGISERHTEKLKPEQVWKRFLGSSGYLKVIPPKCAASPVSQRKTKRS